MKLPIYDLWDMMIPFRMPIYDQISDQVGYQVWNQVKHRIWRQLDAQVYMLVGRQVLQRIIRETQ